MRPWRPPASPEGVHAHTGWGHSLSLNLQAQGSCPDPLDGRKASAQPGAALRGRSPPPAGPGCHWGSPGSSSAVSTSVGTSAPRAAQAPCPVRRTPSTTQLGTRTAVTSAGWRVRSTAGSTGGGGRGVGVRVGTAVPPPGCRHWPDQSTEEWGGLFASRAPLSVEGLGVCTAPS